MAYGADKFGKMMYSQYGGYTLTAIGNKLGTSRTRTHQIYHKAIRNLNKVKRHKAKILIDEMVDESTYLYKTRRHKFLFEYEGDFS